MFYTCQKHEKITSNLLPLIFHIVEEYVIDGQGWNDEFMMALKKMMLNNINSTELTNTTIDTIFLNDFFQTWN